MSDRELWEKRYDSADLIHGAEPSDFLRDNLDLLPAAGLALDLAAGEGRNAVFLAELGYSVIALDISRNALEKCQRLARERRVAVDVAAVDLRAFCLPTLTFDLIINFNYLQRELAPGIIDALRPGGVLVFETLTRAHLRFKPEFNPDYLLSSGELIGLFRGLHLIKYREVDLELGSKKRAVASLLARKPA